jgi:hypothetical protein
LPILEQGLGRGVAKSSTSYHYTVTATDDFDSTWLPTQFPVSDILAPGTWRYDPTTMDFFAADSSTNTRGITYQMTAVVPRPSARAMYDSMTAPETIQRPYTMLPGSLPAKVGRIADRVTHGLYNRYQEAVRLQTWFRKTGGFRYDLEEQPGDGNNALVRFLTRDRGGRVGYCEQFASAYAVMARKLGIPARVAVGFLQPTQAVNGDWIYSAHDLHAWPELYFQGSGWVRFEPTPAGAAPPWTVGSVKKQIHHHAITTLASHPSEATAGRTNPPSPTPKNVTTTPASSTSSGFTVPWTAIALTLGGLVVLTALTLIPGAVRRSRRARRLAGGAEDAWAELRDTAVDLRVTWLAGRSPQEAGAALAEWFGAKPDGAPPVRPPHGRGLAPDAERALDRIVLTLERVRYARAATDIPGALAGDVQLCIEALEDGCTRSTLVRARWLPRSVTTRSATITRVTEREPETVSPGGVHDHVD